MRQMSKRELGMGLLVLLGLALLILPALVGPRERLSKLILPALVAPRERPSDRYVPAQAYVLFGLDHGPYPNGVFCFNVGTKEPVTYSILKISGGQATAVLEGTMQNVDEMLVPCMAARVVQTGSTSARLDVWLPWEKGEAFSFSLPLPDVREVLGAHLSKRVADLASEDTMNVLFCLPADSDRGVLKVPDLFLTSIDELKELTRRTRITAIAFVLSPKTGKKAQASPEGAAAAISTVSCAKPNAPSEEQSAIPSTFSQVYRPIPPVRRKK